MLLKLDLLLIKSKKVEINYSIQVKIVLNSSSSLKISKIYIIAKMKVRKLEERLGM